MDRNQTVARQKAKQVKTKMNWRRVEELLAEKLADRVNIKLKIREADEDFEEDDGLEEGDFTQEEIDDEINAREIAYFFINRHFNKINKVG